VGDKSAKLSRKYQIKKIFDVAPDTAIFRAATLIIEWRGSLLMKKQFSSLEAIDEIAEVNRLRSF